MHNKEMKFRVLLVEHPGEVLGLNEGEVNLFPFAKMILLKRKCIIRR